MVGLFLDLPNGDENEAMKTQSKNVGGRALPQQRPNEAGVPAVPAAPMIVVPAGSQDELLTKEEIAAKLKVDVRTVERWQWAGYIPHLKVGHFVLFHWPDVLQHLQSHFRLIGATRASSPVAPIASSTKEGAR